MGLQERATYLEDDWDDNALTARTSPEEGYFLHPNDALTGAGDYEPGDAFKGVYRPEWDIDSGSPTAKNGELRLPAGATTVQSVRTTARQTIGTWSFDYQFLNSTTTGKLNVSVLRNSNGGSYRYQQESDGDVVLERRAEGGSSFTDLLRVNKTLDTNTHTAKTTRTAYANWEYFWDGTSLGTTTDSTYSTSVQMFAYNNSESEAALDNLQVF